MREEEGEEGGQRESMHDMKVHSWTRSIHAEVEKKGPKEETERVMHVVRTVKLS